MGTLLLCGYCEDLALVVGFGFAKSLRCYTLTHYKSSPCRFYG